MIKEQIFRELQTLLIEQKISPSRAGRDICGDPTLYWRLMNPDKNILTSTLDSVWHYILEKRGQTRMDLDLEKE